MKNILNINRIKITTNLPQPQINRINSLTKLPHPPI